jgi:hypothetical protein
MSKVLTGSKAALKLNGVKIGFVGSVSINEDNTLTDIDVIDQLEVAELAETAHKVSFSCNLFKIDGNSISQLGIQPDNIRDIMTQPELTMELYNSIDDRVEYTISGVKWEGGSGSLDARGVWQGSWNFKGRIGRGM